MRQRQHQGRKRVRQDRPRWWDHRRLHPGARSGQGRRFGRRFVQHPEHAAGRQPIPLFAAVNSGDSTRARRPPPGPRTTVLQPIDNAPVVNRVKAGQTIPVKWRLLTNTGAPIANCLQRHRDRDHARLRARHRDRSGRGGRSRFIRAPRPGEWLYYQFNWQSLKSYAGSCKIMHLNVHDGVTHDAGFQFVESAHAGTVGSPSDAFAGRSLLRGSSNHRRRGSGGGRRRRGGGGRGAR